MPKASKAANDNPIKACGRHQIWVEKLIAKDLFGQIVAYLNTTKSISVYSPIPLRIIQPSAFTAEALTIPPPETRFFLDDGNTTYSCGKCNCVLAENIDVGTLCGKILKCNNCHSYNEVPAAKPEIETVYRNKK